MTWRALLVAALFAAGGLVVAAPVASADCTFTPPFVETCAGDFSSGSCEPERVEYTGVLVRASSLAVLWAAGYTWCYEGDESRGVTVGAGSLGTGVGVDWHATRHQSGETCHLVVWDTLFYDVPYERDLGCPAGPPPEAAWGSMLPPLP